MDQVSLQINSDRPKGVIRLIPQQDCPQADLVSALFCLAKLIAYQRGFTRKWVFASFEWSIDFVTHARARSARRIVAFASFC
jgi:hypothetical protein